MPEANTVNVTELIDRRPMTPLQIGIVVLCGLVALLDGFDSQSIGAAATSIATALNDKVANFGWVFGAGGLGAGIGALSCGPLADRLGRKRMLIAAVLVFAFFTLLTAHATSINMLILWRLFAGIGLGGAMPSFIALTSEYAPQRIRSAMVSVMWAAFPVGGALGGIINSYIIAHYPWQAIFYIGCVLPLIVVLLLATMLPESLRFLLARDGDPERIRRIVTRLAPDVVRPGTRFTATEEKLSGVPVKHLFSEGRTGMTLLLWAIYFMSYSALSIVTFWTPVLLRQNGIAPQLAALTLTPFNTGAVIGMGMAGWLVARMGAGRSMLPALVLGGASVAAMASFSTDFTNAAVLVALIGFFIGIGGAGVVSLSAIVYPTAARSTGIGWGMGMARFGQVVGPIMVGWTQQAAWSTGHVFFLIACIPVVGAFFVLLFQLCVRNVGEGAQDGRPVTAH